MNRWVSSSEVSGTWPWLFQARGNDRTYRQTDRRTHRHTQRQGLWVQESIRERDIKGLQGSDGGLWAKGTFEDPTGVFWAKVIN